MAEPHARFASARAPDGVPEGVDVAAIEAIGRENKPLLQWPGKIRALYEGEVDQRLYREQGFLFFLGLVTCFITIALDRVANPNVVAEGTVLRVATIIPLTFLGVFAAFKRWTRIMAICLAACPIAFMATVVHLSSHLPSDFAATYLTATILVIGIANIVMPFSMRGIIAFNIGMIVSVLSVIALGPPGNVAQHAGFIMLLSLVSAVTLALAHRIEQLRQRNFLLNLRSTITAGELIEANRQLQALSERDPLTGLLNRRGFDRVFDEDVGAAQTADPAAVGAVSLMMIDIDHFKRFNDTHGHQAGDTCLTMVASTLETIFHDAGGVAARFGGEEFVGALREQYSGHANEVAEDIRQAIAALLVPTGADDAPAGRSLVTASVGVGLGRCLWEDGTAEAARALREELLEMADAALYSAKRGGRNRVELVGSDEPIRRSA